MKKSYILMLALNYAADTLYAAQATPQHVPPHYLYKILGRNDCPKAGSYDRLYTPQNVPGLARIVVHLPSTTALRDALLVLPQCLRQQKKQSFFLTKEQCTWMLAYLKATYGTDNYTVLCFDSAKLTGTFTMEEFDCYPGQLFFAYSNDADPYGDPGTFPLAAVQVAQEKSRAGRSRKRPFNYAE